MPHARDQVSMSYIYHNKYNRNRFRNLTAQSQRGQSDKESSLSNVIVFTSILAKFEIVISTILELSLKVKVPFIPVETLLFVIKCIYSLYNFFVITQTIPSITSCFTIIFRTIKWTNSLLYIINFI